MSASFAVLLTLACSLSVIKAEEVEVVDPNCPTLECEHDTWCRNLDGSTMKKTYFYLDDGTKCPACRRCIEDSCPPITCPVWDIPEGCTPKFYNIYVKYNGVVCPICEGYHCQQTI